MTSGFYTLVFLLMLFFFHVCSNQFKFLYHSSIILAVPGQNNSRAKFVYSSRTMDFRKFDKNISVSISDATKVVSNLRTSVGYFQTFAEPS